ncbi:type II toxin-antitoxin system VapC family toxin [Bradyrhizobium sp. USDA 4353]
MAKPKIYIDACCLIEALKKQRGLPLTHPLSEVDMIERTMRAAREGEVELHTSMITIGEVIHLGDKPPPADLKPQVERLLLSGRDGIITTATSPLIVLLARDLAVVDGLWEKVADRIHIATALTVQAVEFFSVDGRLAKRLGKSEVRGCRVISPSSSALLPTKYLQDDFFGKVE